mmetsp:Transcript_3555/g.5142  ORF Transcript_3555/g.5142 Transcript_3555/m.5142 type:complete len:182 (-) Transcript_3555:120-665(-)
MLLACKEQFVSIFDQSLLCTETDEIQVPGNVALVTFCARIVDLVSDSGSCIRSSWQMKESFQKVLFSNVQDEASTATASVSVSEYESSTTSSGRRCGPSRTSSRRRATNTNNAASIASNESSNKPPIIGSSSAVTAASVHTVAAAFARPLMIGHTACLAENFIDPGSNVKGVISQYFFPVR